MKRQKFLEKFFITFKLFSALVPVYVLGGRKPPLNLVADTQGRNDGLWQLNSSYREAYRSHGAFNAERPMAQGTHSVRLRLDRHQLCIHGLKKQGIGSGPVALRKTKPQQIKILP